MLRKSSAVLLYFVFMTLLITAVAGQGVPQQSDPQQQRPRKVFEKEQAPEEVLRFDTDLVSVDVTAADDQGRPVKSLNKDHFRVFVDNVEQPISFFQIEKREGELRPLAVVFALDVSGSMTADEMERVRLALQSFANQLADRPAAYAVMTFGMRVKTVQKFTQDPKKLDDAINRLVRDTPNGLSTHTYDAVDDAVRMLVKSAPRTKEKRLVKRAVLVVTDGFPVGDTVHPKTVIERANAANVSVFVVTLPSFSRMMASSTPLPTPLDVSGLAELTGGRNVYANEKDYGPLFRSLAEEVTSAYVIAFYPEENKRYDGKVHSIRIEGPKGLTLRQSKVEYKAPQR